MSFDQIPIGRFSKLTGLTLKALRYYDSKGLLVPEAKNTITGYRYYTGDQVHEGMLVKYLSTMGFGVDEIIEYLEAEKKGDKERMDSLVENRLKQTQEELERLQRIALLLDIDKHKELMKETMSEPTIKEEPPVRILSKKATGISPEIIGRLLEELVQTVNSPENQSNFVRIIGPPVTMYYDKKYSEEEGELEVAFPISGKISINDPEMEVKNLPKRKVLSVVHKGSYDTIVFAYNAVFDYIKENDHEIVGPMADIYLSDPHTVKPDDLMTEVQVPIK